MGENKTFDLEAMMAELSGRLEAMVEDALADTVEDTVSCAVRDAMDEALHDSLSRFEFVLADGTIVRPRAHMKLLSPDKTKLLRCFGGLRVDGSTLHIQTGATCWERIASYSGREEAIEALMKVKDAMEKELSLLEL